jgi:hypothetical protein
LNCKFYGIGLQVVVLGDFFPALMTGAFSLEKQLIGNSPEGRIANIRLSPTKVLAACKADKLRPLMAPGKLQPST